MPVEITMPQQSDTMTEGTVVKWLKAEGDKVKAGELIAEIETDKAVMEMESFEAGTLAQILAPVGTKVAVGKAIAILATGSESVDSVKSKGATAGSAKAEAPRVAATSVASSSSSSVEPATEVAATQHTASNGTRSATERLRVSPLARRIAEDKGIDLAQVTGTGPGGRIVQKDVEAFKAPTKESAAPVATEVPTPAASVPVVAKKVAPKGPTLPTRLPTGSKEVIPLTKMRSVIAQRLQQSKQTVPHFYETVDIELEEVVAVRERMNKSMEKTGIRISVGDFVAKAVATALVQQPALNATFNGTEVTQYADVHLGMAVALPNGLIVPVLRNINQMGLAEIRVRSADLVDRARGQKLKGDEMTGATFTVSNLGTMGVREFSAIINPPEVGILAIGSADKRAVVRGDSIVARTMMTVTLSADHRVVDGAVAAEFLKTLKGLLEEPGMMLI